MPTDTPYVAAISASFTAEPIQASLEFWMPRLHIDADIRFSAFNQIFQSLLDPGSLFATNRKGVNVVLIRWEDLGSADPLRENGRNLIRTLKQTAGSFPAPLLVASCPCSEHFLADEGNASVIRQLDSEIETELTGTTGLFLLRASEVADWYPVTDIHDPASDRLGQVPYTAEYFTALGTSIARKAIAIDRLPLKIAVLDLDNTLWQGVVGEDGPARVIVDDYRTALQSFFLKQREQGTLLGICSKNNEEDAVEVFRLHPGMPLQPDHFAGTRINWEQKSNNLRSLAAELSLGLDSFVFVDDDSRECAEVVANCPEVLTLQLPAEPAEIAPFLKNVWAFDRLVVTKEDLQRSESYRQEQQRTKVIRQAATLEEFIAGLELRISAQSILPAQVPRVAQLTLRTNQFNTTGIRRTEAEVQNFAAEPGTGCLTVDVSDRFGDYGLVGAVFFRMKEEALVVESFFMSCRVLGRGVEHEIVRRLGRMAQEAGRKRVEIEFVPTKKNVPARSFLDSMPAEIRPAVGDVVRYSLDAAAACDLAYRPVESEETVETSTAAGQTVARSPIDYAGIARDFRDVGRIMAAMRMERVAPAVEIAVSDLPRNEVERKLAAIWAEILGVPAVGIHDDFFEMGGYSLLAVELLREIITTFDVQDFTLSAILEAPTVAKFAELLGSAAAPKFSCLVPLRATGSRQPFFCVHGAGGNVLSQRPLAMNLPEDQPFWCIQARGLDGSGMSDDLRDTAALYIREIRMVQPKGPYMIGGGSYGGLFAYEMAQQLTAQGEEVSLLALFDTYNLRYGQMIPKSKLLYYNVRFVVQRGVRQIATLARSPLAEWPRRLSSAARATARVLQYMLSNLSSNPESQSQPLPAGPKAGDYDNSGLSDLLIRVRNCTIRASEAYVPQPYAGKLTLFNARIRLLEPFEDRYLGWGPLVKSIETHEIPGDHVTMGNSQAFADALDACMRRAQDRTSPAADAEAMLPAVR